MSKKKCIFTAPGTAALAAAVVVAGIGFGPAASAAPAAETTTNASITAAPAAPTLTAKQKYTDSAGRTQYAYTVRGAAGATIQVGYTSSSNWYDRGTVGASGTGSAITEFNAESASVDIRLKVGNEVSSKITVQKGALSAGIPAPTVTSAKRYTNLNGTTRYAYTIAGAPNTTVQYGGSSSPWRNLGPIGASGTATFIDVDGSATSNFDFRVSNFTVASSKFVLKPSDVSTGLPAPTVTNAIRYADANGSTRYAYTVTGAAHTRVQYGSAASIWGALGDLGASGSARFSDANGSSTGNWDFRLATNDTVSPKTQIAPSAVNLAATDIVQGKAGPAVELTRDGDSTVYAHGRVIKANTKAVDATVRFTAPTGTTFKAGQNTINGQFGLDSGWADSGYLRLTDGVRSADGRTYTYNWKTDMSSVVPTNLDFRFGITVNSPKDAAAGSSTLKSSTVGMTSNGAFAANSSTATTIAPAVALPTGTVTFDEDVSKKATVSGTGVDGALITLFQGDSSKQIGSARIEGGKWSTTIDPIGAGDQKIRIEQSGIEGIQTAETTAKYGAAVTLDRPASSTVAPGEVTVTGTGQAGATVTITGGVAPVTAQVRDNDTFTATVELAPSHSAVTLTARQASKGNLRTTDAFTVTPDGAQQDREVVITEPSSHTYKAGQETTVRGTATPYAEIEIRFQWSDAVQGKVSADKNGNWSFTRAYGPAAKYELTATQTRYDGSTSTSAKFALNPEGLMNQDVVITGPANHTYTPGQPTRITGTATPYANIEIRFQWNDTVYGRATANADGNWNIVRQYGPGATYDITAKQLRADGTTSYSETFSLSPENTNRPLTLTTPEMTSTFQPDQDVSFTGTGTPGATITAIAPDWNNGLIFQTKVDNNGNWKQLRKFTPGLAYNLTILHQPIDGDETRIEGIHLNPAN